ncbi:MAG: hypothetical protein AAFV53_40555 [Myxococcota bacterium]
MAATLGSSDAPGQGLFTYSGHGSRQGNGLLLCPADLQSDFENAVGFQTLSQILDQHAPESSVTAFLDTCHSARILGGLRRLQRLGKRSLVHAGVDIDGFPLKRFRDQDVVLAACRAMEMSYEYPMQARFNGAFTWAASTLLSRQGMGVSAESGARFFRISYGDFIQQSQELLAMLDFEQRPVYEGPESMKTMLMFSTDAADATDGANDEQAHGSDRELSPEDLEGPLGVAAYQILNLHTQQPIGYVIVVGDSPYNFNGYTLQPEHEYWWWETQPFPTDGWFLTPSLMSKVPSFNPNQSYQYMNQQFTGSPQEATVNKTPDTWWEIAISDVNGLSPQCGWLCMDPGNYHATWYDYVDQNSNPYFTMANGQYLRFYHAVGGPSSSTDRHVGDHQPTDPNQYVLVDVRIISSSPLSIP